MWITVYMIHFLFEGFVAAVVAFALNEVTIATFNLSDDDINAITFGTHENPFHGSVYNWPSKC